MKLIVPDLEIAILEYMVVIHLFDENLQVTYVHGDVEYTIRHDKFSCAGSEKFKIFVPKGGRYGRFFYLREELLQFNDEMLLARGELYRNLKLFRGDNYIKALIFIKDFFNNPKDLKGVYEQYKNTLEGMYKEL